MKLRKHMPSIVAVLMLISCTRPEVGYVPVGTVPTEKQPPTAKSREKKETEKAEADPLPLPERPYKKEK